MFVRPRGYTFFPCSIQLSTNHIPLINVKMPTIVGVLTFISMINTTSERLKACRTYSFVSILLLRAFEIPCSVELSMDFL